MRRNLLARAVHQLHPSTQWQEARLLQLAPPLLPPMDGGRGNASKRAIISGMEAISISSAGI